jgi:hypothetical protein
LPSDVGFYNVLCNNIEYFHYLEYLMSNPLQETEIAGEIERLRGEFPKTPDLYREVCVLLFFRYGITPTTNRLYQLVRKGSMSAPGDALNAFWKQLRDSSRISVVAPEVPESLRDAAGQLAVAYWKSAQQGAEEAFAILRKESQAQVDESRMALSAADEVANSRQHLLEEKESELQAERRANLGLASKVAALHDEIERLEGELEASKRETIAISARLEEAYSIHAKEIQAAHTAASQVRDGFVASEKRFLLDLDRERTVAAKVQKQLESERASKRLEVEKLRGDMENLHSEAGALRQSLGLLEGQLKAAQEVQVENAAALQVRNAEITILTERYIRAELKLEQQIVECSAKAEASDKEPLLADEPVTQKRSGSRARRTKDKPT